MRAHPHLRSLLFMVIMIGAGATVRAAEPSFDQTARDLLELAKAVRTAYVLQVVEHVRSSGIQPNEDWVKAAHLVPLPAQFVKGAAEQVSGFEPDWAHSAEQRQPSKIASRDRRAPQARGQSRPLKRDSTPEGMTLDPGPPKRPAGPLEPLTPNSNVPPPWVR